MAWKQNNSYMSDKLFFLNKLQFLNSLKKNAQWFKWNLMMQIVKKIFELRFIWHHSNNILNWVCTQMMSPLLLSFLCFVYIYTETIMVWFKNFYEDQDWKLLLSSRLKMSLYVYQFRILIVYPNTLHIKIELTQPSSRSYVRVFIHIYTCFHVYENM